MPEAVKQAVKKRQGAVGRPKVKTGCRTCKIRHKKCDEAKPACSQCTSTSRHCDFLTPSQRHPSEPAPLVFVAETVPVRHRSSPSASGSSTGGGLPSAQLGLPDHLKHLSDIEVALFDYFRFTCAQEFSLYFQSPIWEQFVLCAAHAEAWAFHAAVAISALSRRNYVPAHNDTISCLDFTTLHYNQAIRVLNKQLDTTNRSAELAILGSVLFINIEFLRHTHASEHRPDGRNLVDIHLRGGLAIMKNLEAIWGDHLSQNARHLRIALDIVQGQVELLGNYQPQ